MDGAVYSASAKQRIVSRVHDRVDGQPGDVRLLRKYSTPDGHSRVSLRIAAVARAENAESAGRRELVSGQDRT